MSRLLTLLLLLPAAAEACPVCFGKTSDKTGQSIALGLTWGIAILFVATFALLAGFAYAVYRLEKNKELKEAESGTF